MLNNKQIFELLNNPDKQNEIIAISVEDLKQLLISTMREGISHYCEDISDETINDWYMYDFINYQIYLGE